MAAEVLVDAGLGYAGLGYEGLGYEGLGYEGLGYECFPMRIRKYHGCAAMVSGQIWRGL
jgi:uncharacterized membrane protein